MKIYFAGSITGGRDDKEIYFEIIGILSAYGSVLTEHVGYQGLSELGELEKGLSDNHVYERDMAWLNDADVMVAEVSVRSMGVGYEIGKMEGKKPILCLHRKGQKRLSPMINGNKNINIETYESVKDLENILENFLKNVKI